MHRRYTTILLALSLTALIGVPVAAQDPAIEAIGPGGRVDVPEAGYSVTLPNDWVHVRPNAADTSSILDAVRSVSPELASMVEAGLAGGTSLSLVAIGPIEPGTSFAVNCNVVSSPAGGLSLGLRVVGEVAAYRAALGDMLVDGPDVVELDLPAGDAARLDARLRFPGYESASSSYVYTDGDMFHVLTCTDLDWPEDRWLPMAETFEYLPPAS